MILIGNTLEAMVANQLAKTFQIHPTALISPGAQIASNVSIGPYTLIGENVSIGSGCVIGAHVVIDGWTSIGEGNQISTGAVIGNCPQDMKFNGEVSYVVMGNHNIIREYVTINRGTTGGGGITRIGNKNLLMTAVHVAHDVQIGHHNVIANAVGIAGHVEIEDWVTLGFASGIHQFVVLGRMAMVGAGSMISKDVTPFTIITGNPPKLYGLNIERLRRNNFSLAARKELAHAYKLIFKSGHTLEEVIPKLQDEFPGNEHVAHLHGFLCKSSRGIYR